MDPDRGARRNLYIFGATSFLNDTASEMAYWILPAFLTSLGAGPAALGLIEGLAESVASLGKLFSGYFTDVLTRRKPLVVFGYMLANAAKPVLALATSWTHVLLVRFADRTAKGIRGAPRDVMLAESVAQGKAGSAFGLLQSMDSAGAIAGPLLALLILSRTNSMRTVFWAAAVPGFLAILTVLLARETGKTRSGPLPAFNLWKPGALSRRFYYMLAAVLVFSLGNSSDAFLVLRAQQAGIGPAFAPLLGLVFNVTYTLSAWPAGWLSDRRSKPVIAAIGYLIFAATYAVFAAAPSKTALWMTMAMYGLYYALTSPVLRALVIETVPLESRGRAFGLFYFSSSIATLLSSVLTGVLWKMFGPALPFYLSSALAVIGAFMLLGSGYGFSKRPEHGADRVIC
ncbi:MAG TPA: MFS transporter [Candidatus Saccharimonadales bacterium]|jgi:MFS family permease|nr:MFS transporter [Candidatus Saccharimonadales bacterium]